MHVDPYLVLCNHMRISQVSSRPTARKAFSARLAAFEILKSVVFEYEKPDWNSLENIPTGLVQQARLGRENPSSKGRW